jgi:hypothetical protein
MSLISTTKTITISFTSSAEVFSTTLKSEKRFHSSGKQMPQMPPVVTGKVFLIITFLAIHPYPYLERIRICKATSSSCLMVPEVWFSRKRKNGRLRWMQPFSFMM